MRSVARLDEPRANCLLVVDDRVLVGGAEASLAEFDGDLRGWCRSTRLQGGRVVHAVGRASRRALDGIR